MKLRQPPFGDGKVPIPAEMQNLVDEGERLMYCQVGSPGDFAESSFD